MTLLNRILDSKSISSTYLVMLLLVSVLAIETQANSCFEPDAEPFPIWGPNSTYPACAPGFYCPNLDTSNSTTWPVICPPSQACEIMRITNQWCGPQGVFDPTICTAGYYCPPPGQQMLKCPSGHYCPIGSAEPTPCPWLSVCAEGAAEARQVGTILVLVVVDLAVGLSFVAYYYYRQHKHAKQFSIDGSAAAKDIESAPTPSATQVLIDGFNLSRGNQQLLDFEFDNLGLSLPDGKKILEGVTGRIEHGQVTAILGPSGAGKTTFLSTLMGKIDSSWKAEGSLRVNGVESKGLSKLKRLVGYVPQEDIMHRELSVWQNLQYSADIRLPRDWTREQRQRHVKAVLEVLELNHVRNSAIGDESTRGVSGGQRKRVNIGMELAASPLALFCDEPTSGLDSSASLSVVTAIKKVTQATGITAVMVIHQPRQEIWNSLDRVLILAPGGLTAYNHEQRYTIPYFNTMFGVRFPRTDNPADVIMDYIASHGSECTRIWESQGKEWLSEFVAQNPLYSPADYDDRVSLGASADSIRAELANTKSSEKKTKKKKSKRTNTNEVEMETVGDSSAIVAPERDNADDKVIRGANYLWQTWYVLVRSLKSQYANFDSLALEMGLALVAGAIIGFSAQLHFSGVVIAPYSTLSPNAPMNLVPMKSMYISLSIGVAAASAGVKTFSEDMVIYWRETSAGHSRLAYYIGTSLSVIPRIILGGLHFTAVFQVLSLAYAPFGQLMVNHSLLFFAVYGLSAVVSMIVPRKDAALLAAVAAVIAAVLNGFVHTIPTGLDYISYAYWSDNAFFTGEIGPVRHVYDWKVTADYFGLVADRLSLDFGMMFVIGVIYRIIGFALLTLRNRDKQR